MLTRTHIAISLFFILILINGISNQLDFVLITLIATLLPDIDTKFSKLGKKIFFRPIQFLVEHRGLFHSIIFLILIMLPFILFFPNLAFGFFLGYGLHLIADSLTIHGIQPFYPFKSKLKIRGFIRTGGILELSLFIILTVINVILISLMMLNLLAGININTIFYTLKHI